LFFVFGRDHKGRAFALAFFRWTPAKKELRQLLNPSRGSAFTGNPSPDRRENPWHCAESINQIASLRSQWQDWNDSGK